MYYQRAMRTSVKVRAGSIKGDGTLPVTHTMLPVTLVHSTNVAKSLPAMPMPDSIKNFTLVNHPAWPAILLRMDIMCVRLSWLGRLLPSLPAPHPPLFL